MRVISGAEALRYPETERRAAGIPAAVEDIVQRILAGVKEEGDAALLRLTAELDGVTLTQDDLEVPRAEAEAAAGTADPSFMAALRQAAGNITRFHQQQVTASWLQDGPGVIAGQLVRPLGRVGVYVPGGGAAYPSSVLMTVIPARVAGVREVVACTPPARDGRVHPQTLAALAVAGVDRIFRVGGAQAIAAMAFGTETIPAVDKIVGPGNAYVTAAKRLVFGFVDIDMLAGPSEVAVVADDTAPPGWVAADLLAQAEHDPAARVLLVTTSRALMQHVLSLLAGEPEGDAAARTVREHGLGVLAADMNEAMSVVNAWAPEHLQLQVRDPIAWLPRVENAGAVFLGPFSPVPAGDYWVGPNHVLPTGGGARFFSPLGTGDFVKRINFLSWSEAALRDAASGIAALARAEGLPRHARAVEIRCRQEKDAASMVGAGNGGCGP